MPITKFERGFHELVERGISLVNPEAAGQRRFNRKLYEMAAGGGYEAANPGRERGSSGGLYANASSESRKNRSDRLKLMWEARDLTRQYSFMKSVLYKESLYVAGKLRYQANTGDPNADRVIEDLIEGWSARADITGRHVLRELVSLAHRGMRCDGDFGFIIVPYGDEIRLQSIESDRIGSPIDAQISNTYFQGITINTLGQVVSYKIYERTHEGQYKNPVEVPPDSFIHYFDPGRVDQYRGVTAFDTVIAHARDIHELYRMEKLAVKWGSSLAGVIHKKSDRNPEWDKQPIQKTTGQGTGMDQIESGKLVRLEPGEDINMFHNFNRPSPTFTGFIGHLVREMANGLGLPYSFVWDMAALGGVSARIELEMAQRVFKHFQNLLVEQVLDKVKTAVLNRAMGFGKIPPIPTYLQGKWQFPAHITADIGYQTGADIQMLQNGLKTQSDVYAERGLDFEEEVDKRAREIARYWQVAQQYGIPIELLNQGLPGASQLIAMMNMPPEAAAAMEAAQNVK